MIDDLNINLIHIFMCVNKNYYEILNIPYNATQEQIRAGYKSKALDHHPDKSQENQIIYEVNEAYEILKDPDKRKKYDLEMNIVKDKDMNMDHIMTLFMMFVGPLLQVLLGILQTKKEEPKLNQQKTKVSTPPISLSLAVSLEDLYLKRIKKIRFHRMMKGEKQTHTLYISLYNYQDEYVFKNQGDDHSSDVIVSLSVEEHPLYLLDKLVDRYDLWMELDLSLYEFYYGKQTSIYFLDGSQIHLSHTFQSQNHLVKTIEGKGLPYYNEETDTEMYGNLYASYRLKLKSLTDDEFKNPEVENILKNLL
jgi:DnaJ-class molecular chaperone